jgi:hypothetical protein
LSFEVEREAIYAAHCVDPKLMPCTDFDDFATACPSIAREYCLAALKAQGVHELIIRAISMLYVGCYHQLFFAGSLHCGWKMESGAQQGDPMSALSVWSCSQPILGISSFSYS